jgi:hypothetical protein
MFQNLSILEQKANRNEIPDEVSRTMNSENGCYSVSKILSCWDTEDQNIKKNNFTITRLEIT